MSHHSSCLLERALDGVIQATAAMNSLRVLRDKVRENLPCLIDVVLTELFSLGGYYSATRCMPASENSGLSALTIYSIAIDLCCNR
jgi:hypothetical protein